MKDKRLRNALITGTAALLWSVPSLNLMGIVGAIISWSAYSKPRRSSAYLASAFYMTAAAGSMIFAGVLLNIAGKGIVTDENAFSSMCVFMAAFSVFGDVMYILSAVWSIGAAKALPEDSSDNNGFFD